MRIFAAASLVLMLMIGGASADMREATVYTVHGIPGVVVDVEVEGVGCALTQFDFGDIAGPLSLPAPAAIPGRQGHFPRTYLYSN